MTDRRILNAPATPERAWRLLGEPGQGMRETLQALREIVKPGGRILIGEGYWRREPPAAYLEATGIASSDLTTHQANKALATQTGLTLHHEEVSSHEEWDEFEGLFLEAAEAAHRQAPEDAAAKAESERRTKWNESYRRWGRDTMGFGFYVFSRPDPAAPA